MMAPTHKAGGTTLWLLFVAVLPIPLAIAPLVALVGAPVARRTSLWPDWDHDRATMVYRYGRRQPALRWSRRNGPRLVTVRKPGKLAQRFARFLKKKFGGHRGGTHSFLAGVPLCGPIAGVPALVLGIVLVKFTDVSIGTTAVLVGTVFGAAIVGAASHSLLDGLTCNCRYCDPDPNRPPHSEEPHTDRYGNPQAGCMFLWPVVKRRFGIPWMPVEGDTEKKLLEILEVAQLGAAAILLLTWAIRAWNATEPAIFGLGG